MNGFEVFLIIYGVLNAVCVLPSYVAYISLDEEPKLIVHRIFESEEINIYGKIVFSILFVLLCLPAVLFAWTVFGIFAGTAWIFWKLFFKKEKEQ